MAGLKEVRERIVSVKSTQQITKAMKLVSAAKLKKASSKIFQMRPYADKLNEVLQNLVRGMDDQAISSNPLSEVRPVNRVLITIFTSDRGLCGGFNANILKLTKKTIAHYQSQNIAFKVMPIGKKAMEFCKKMNYPADYSHVNLFKNLSFEACNVISQLIIDKYLAKEIDAAEILYAKFKNAAVQEMTKETFLPIQNNTDTSKSNSSKGLDYIYQPEKEKLIQDILPQILKTTFFKCALDSNASEHGARMVAMESATNNAADLIKKLQIEYNKARQAAITSQIMEIVGGAAALEG
ncbi:MAG: ATP synthase F1 subunit gamma [Chitinophagales bacterium]|jgi:F-type H+-transporting ATPase subunit gamma|nr:ATP synthase F1 subunit gamma [Chitinophagales bacterium]